MDATITAERTRPYEGMFLFPQSATADLQGAVDHVKEILGRSGAEILSIAKWDERRLAYDIKGNKRGVYFLVYFSATRRSSPPSSATRDSARSSCAR